MVQRLPRIELADLLIEVDRWTGFTKHFTHAGGAKPRNPDLTRHLYATILAQACNFGLTTMAEVSDHSYRQLAWTTDWYLREETLKAAFSSLVDYQHCLPLAQAWGGGPYRPPMASDSQCEEEPRTRRPFPDTSAWGKG